MWLAAVLWVWHRWSRLLLVIFRLRSRWSREVRVGFPTRHGGCVKCTRRMKRNRIPIP